MFKKTITRGAALFAAFFMIAGCEKRDNTAPVADTELQSAIDLSWATFVVTDVLQICGFAGEKVYLDHFYHHVDDTPEPNRFDATYNQEGTRVSFVFHDTPCVDGKLRGGEVRQDIISSAQQNADKYHAFGFESQVFLIAYRVDGWQVTSEGPAVLKNELVSSQWDPRKTNLVWSIEGKFSFTHPDEPGRNMTWNGKLKKVLTNTSDNAVYSSTRQPAITWSLATLGYHGTFGGVVLGDKPYTMKVAENEMLMRDMTCSPDLLGASVAGGDLQPIHSEFHPFIGGAATLELQGRYPRRVFFGNGTDPLQPGQCDNTGQVLIKGLLYRVNFQK